MYDIVAIGESLIDFAPAGRSDTGMPLFSQNPGGAPANVLAMNAKLGGHTAFIGKVGRDAFGTFLRTAVQAAGVDCTGMCCDEKVPTTLAFVQLDEKGDRSFTFYRNPGADLMLRPEEIDPSLTENCRIFHYGSVSLTGEPCRSTVLDAARRAKTAGALISYDPNYRPFLWNDEKRACSEMLGAMKYADILKVNEEEMALLAGTDDLREGALRLRNYGPEAVFVTRGEKGAYFITPAGEGEVPAVRVKAVDTTGAGDAFWGALLWHITGRGRSALCTMTQEEWKKAAAFAAAAGSLTAAAKGAIPAMPDRAAIEACLAGSFPQ